MVMVDPRGTTNALAEGYSMLQGIQQDRARRMAGNALAGGNTQAAMSALGGVGDLQSVQAIQQQAQEEQARQQRVQQAMALQGGDTSGAVGIAAGAGDIEGMAQIQQWAARASEAERKQAAENAQQLAIVAYSLRDLPLEQRHARALQLAPQFGLDPSQITPDLLTDEGIDAFVTQVIGLSDFLAVQERREDNARQQAQLEETMRHNRATEGVAASREARVGRGRASGGGGGRSGGAAVPAASGGSSLPAGFRIRGR